MRTKIPAGWTVTYRYTNPEGNEVFGFGKVLNDQQMIGTDYGYAIEREEGGVVYVRDSGINEALCNKIA